MNGTANDGAALTMRAFSSWDQERDRMAQLLATLPCFSNTESQYTLLTDLNLHALNHLPVAQSYGTATQAFVEQVVAYCLMINLQFMPAVLRCLEEHDMHMQPKDKEEVLTLLSQIVANNELASVLVELHEKISDPTRFKTALSTFAESFTTRLDQEKQVQDKLSALNLNLNQGPIARSSQQKARRPGR